MIDGRMTVREISQSFPQTRALLESLGFAEGCLDCDFEAVAKRHGLRPQELLDALNLIVFGRPVKPDAADAEQIEREEKFWSPS